MHWNRRYAIKSYIKSSLWLVPFFAVMLYMVVHRITFGIDSWLLRTGQIDEKISFFGLTIVGARTALDTIVTLNLSFLVFTFGSLLIAIQVAGGQYTPRIIATTLLRDNAIRFTVGYFVFTLLFAFRVLTRMGDEIVHQFNMFIAALLGLVSIVVFLYLIDYAARFLRPVSIVTRVGESGLAVIKNVYPESTKYPRSLETSPRPASPNRIVANAGGSGVVLAIDLDGLVAQARQASGMMSLSPRWATSWRRVSHCSGCMGAPAPWTTVSYRRQSHSGQNVLSSRTPPLPSASWSISRSKHCRRPSMIRRRPCSPSISFIVCFGGSACSLSAAKRSATKPVNHDSFSGRRTGRILCTSLASRYVIAGQAASRSCGDCVRCSKISCKPCRHTVIPSCACNWSFWIAR